MSAVSNPASRLALGIPTRGRPVILKETLADLDKQTRRPDAIFVAYYELSDLGDAPAAFPKVTFIKGTGGSCEQRNRLLDAFDSSFDLVFMMDDDCYLHRDYLARTEELFLAEPGVVGSTGKLLENGANGPGLEGDYARRLLRALGPAPTLAEQPATPAFNADGCNMAFRNAAIQSHGVRFDEAMPGYAWFEDIDFSRRLLPYGALVTLASAMAVHLGAKVGKTSGKRLGYSQVANPIYLMRKGIFPWDHLLGALGRNCVANLVRSLAPEPYIDRRGRLTGNLIAWADLLRGRLRPDRILQL